MPPPPASETDPAAVRRQLANSRRLEIERSRHNRLDSKKYEVRKETLLRSQIERSRRQEAVAIAASTATGGDVPVLSAKAAAKVLDQLRCSGVIEAVRVMRS